MTTALQASASEAPERTGRYAWYVAVMLSAAFLLSMGDRYLMGVLLEEVKHDLGLNDTQLGILGGPSFVLLFLVASIPFGRLADTANRKLVIVAGMVCWSLATAACGLANNFPQLMAARLCIGLGEAALVPNAISLIAAYFSRDKLGRGIAVFSTGSSLGRFVAFAGGGALLAVFAASSGAQLGELASFKPWQAVFITGGLLGLVVALLFLITVREPPRRGPAAQADDLRAGFGHFWRHRRAYLSVFVPFGMVSGLAVVLAAWSVSFLLRSHGMSVPVASAAMGLIGLVFGPIGHLSGGWLNDRMRNQGHVGAQPVVLSVILGLAAACVGLFAAAPNLKVALGIYCVGYIFLCAAAPIAYSGMQMPTPDRYRGVMSAIFLIVYSAIGSGVGPLLVGLYGDYYFRDESMLGASIILTAITLAVVGIPAALAGRAKFQKAVRANEWDRAPKGPEG